MCLCVGTRTTRSCPPEREQDSCASLGLGRSRHVTSTWARGRSPGWQLAVNIGWQLSGCAAASSSKQRDSQRPDSHETQKPMAAQRPLPMSFLGIILCCCFCCCLFFLFPHSWRRARCFPDHWVLRAQRCAASSTAQTMFAGANIDNDNTTTTTTTTTTTSMVTKNPSSVSSLASWMSGVALCILLATTASLTLYPPLVPPETRPEVSHSRGLAFCPALMQPACA